MNAWKVLKNENGKLLSAGDIPSDKRIEYSTTERSFPIIEGSKLFVFKSFKEAKVFWADTTHRWDCEIWLVDVPEMYRVTILPRLWTRNLSSIILQDYWKWFLDWDYESTHYESNFGMASDNVYVTPSIKLVEMVFKYEKGSI